MIKCTEASIEIEGDGLELLTELSVIVHGLYLKMSEIGGKETVKKLIREQVEMGMKSEKELMKDIKDLINEMMEEDEDDE